MIDLVARMQADDRLAVIGAPYPKRRINWSLVASAAAKGLAAVIVGGSVLALRMTRTLKV
mgnify:CR=1 FL=1